MLRLENNRLEALPDNMGELCSLVRLDVSTNCLRALPASMGRLKRIQRIDAAANVLGRVPPAFGHIKSLKELNLRCVCVCVCGSVVAGQDRVWRGRQHAGKCLLWAASKGWRHTQVRRAANAPQVQPAR